METTPAPLPPDQAADLAALAQEADAQADPWPGKAIIAKLKKTNPDIRLVTISEGVPYLAVVRPPQDGDYRECMEGCADPKTRYEAQAQLVRSCLLVPTKERFNSDLEARPGLAASIWSKLIEMAGLTDKVRVVKL